MTIYFTGSTPATGRELWAYPSGTQQVALEFEASSEAGATSGAPLEMRASGQLLTWRSSSDAGSPPVWRLRDAGGAVHDLGMLSAVFDFNLPLERIQASAWSGGLFWASSSVGQGLTAWADDGHLVSTVPLVGYSRHALQDTLGAPAYAALIERETGPGHAFASEQLIVLMPQGGGWTSVQATAGAHADDRIDRIVGLPLAAGPGGTPVKPLFFSGRWAGQEGLFEVLVGQPGGVWSALGEPEPVDLGTPLRPKMMLTVEAGAFGQTSGRLYFLGTDPTGKTHFVQYTPDGSPAAPARVVDVLVGTDVTGLDMQPVDGGVVVSMTGTFPGSGGILSRVERFSIDGVGGIARTTLVETADALGDLSVDASGRLAYVRSDPEGNHQLWVHDGTHHQAVGPHLDVGDVEVANGHVVFSAESQLGSGRALYDLSFGAAAAVELGSAEPTSGSGADSIRNPSRAVSLQGGLAFPAITDALGTESLIVTSNDNRLLDTGLYTRGAPGTSYFSGWVGTAEANNGTGRGLYHVDLSSTGTGTVTLLAPAAAQQVLKPDVEVVNDEVLWGSGTDLGARTLLTGISTRDLPGHLGAELGIVEPVGNDLILTVRDSDGVWRLLRYDGAATQTLGVLPDQPPQEAIEPFGEWSGERDFLGDQNHLFWIQNGELYTHNRVTHTSSHVGPVFADESDEFGVPVYRGTFAGGRLYYVSTSSGVLGELWSTTNGLDAQPVPLIAGGLGAPATGPTTPVVWGGDVYFFSNRDGHVGLYQIKAGDDFATTPLFTFDTIDPGQRADLHSLVATESGLHFIIGSQIWTFNPGGLPVPLPLFTAPDDAPIDDLVGGPSDRLYFVVDEEAYGREMWTMSTSPFVGGTGAQRIADINDGRRSNGYEPEQLLAVPATDTGTTAALSMVNGAAYAFRITPVSASMAEGNPGDAPNAVVLRVERPASVVFSPTLTLNLQVEASTDPAVDPAESDDIVGGFGTRSVTFNYGDVFVDLRIDLAGDDRIEADEVFTVRPLWNESPVSPRYFVGDLRPQLTIVNDDRVLAREVHWQSAAGTVTTVPEGDPSPYDNGLQVQAEFMLVGSGLVPGQVIHYTVGPSSIIGGVNPAAPAAGGDVVGGFGPRTLTLPNDFAGGSVPIRVEVVGDFAVEGREAFQVTLDSVDIGTISGDATRVGVIQDDEPIVSVEFPGGSFVDERSPPASGLVQPSSLDVRLDRIQGNPDVPVTVTYRLSALPGAANPVGADDFGTGTQDPQVTRDFAFESIGPLPYQGSFVLHGQNDVLRIPVVPDALHEADERFRFELLGVSLGTIDGTTTQDVTIVDDDRWSFEIAGADSAAEGSVYQLTLSNDSTLGLAAAQSYGVDWGDGTRSDVLSPPSGAQMVLSHVYDDRDGAVGGSYQVRVQGFGPDRSVDDIRTHMVEVNDLPPTGIVELFGGYVEVGGSFFAMLLSYSDPSPRDPLLGMVVDWGDGTPVVPSSQMDQAFHRYDRLGTFLVRFEVINDDGIFLVQESMVHTYEHLSGAAPNGTVVEIASSWSSRAVQFSHRANAGSTTEAWTPVKLEQVNSGALAGGDLFGASLGVSGRTVPAKPVPIPPGTRLEQPVQRQEIDGTEGLRLDLTPGSRADRVDLQLGRLFSNDVPGQHEAMRIQFFNGSQELTSRTFVANQDNGLRGISVEHLPEFTSLVLTAGAQDPVTGAWMPGAMVTSGGSVVPLTPYAGSDFLINRIDVFHTGAPLPQVDLVGVPG